MTPSRTRRRACACQKGSAVVEFAVVLPVLVVVLMGTIDFARVMYWAMALTNAARAGVQYGALSLANSADTAGIQTAAQNSAASDLPGGIAAPIVARTCSCNGGAATAGVCSASCTNPLRVFVSVTTTKTFTTAMHYPGVPSSLALSRTVMMRAQ